MNLKELKKLVASGESDRIEFKSTTGQRTQAMKTVCGMLNGFGGFVFFGVSDKGELIGQDATAKTMADISAELNRLDPPAFPDIETVTLENGKAVIMLRVPGGGGLYIYDDRMEIINPGALHFGITPKALFHPHESRPWNPIIANVFYRAGIIEKWGTGTLNIIEWCKENGNPLPEWNMSSGSVALIFKPLVDKVARKPESQPESQPESLRDRIIHLLSNDMLSKSEISNQLGQKQISGQLKKILIELINEGVLSFTIPDKPKSRLQKYKLIKKTKTKNK